MRQRFNSNRLCSSENYALSKAVRRTHIQNWHQKNIDEVRSISQRTPVKPTYFVKCFDKLIEITEAEAARLGSTMEIIRK